MQPLQRSYAITEDRIESMIQKGVLSSIYDEGKVYELENSIETDAEKKAKELKTLKKLKENKPLYDSLLEALRSNLSDKVFYRLSDFEPVIKMILAGFDKKIISKVIDGLSVMDKKAEIHKDKKGIVYDTETKDTEIVKWDEKIDDYMAREVLPHIPDAKAFFEAEDENATFEDNVLAKKVKIGAEIPFTRYFYKYQEPTPSEDLLKKFKELESTVREKIDGLF